MIDIIVSKRMSKVQSPNKSLAAETVQLCSTLAATNSQRSSAELTTKQNS